LYPSTHDVLTTGSLAVYANNARLKADTSLTGSNNEPVGIALNASASSDLYQDGLTEVRVNALFGLNIIRAF